MRRKYLSVKNISVKNISIMLFVIQLLLLSFGSYAETPNVFPGEAILRLTLYKEPDQDTFTRYLVFQEYNENTVAIAFDFTKTDSLKYQAIVDSSIQSELDKFIFICTNGNRGYWDQMRLENQGDLMALFIKHIYFEITYNGGAGNRTIPILNWEIYKELPVANSFGLNERLHNSSIELNRYAQYSRVQWVEQEVKTITNMEYTYDANNHHAFLSAILDMGKCGTSGVGDDEYGDNPKYGDDTALCSEFVSWYYANEGTPFGKKIFQDIGFHTTLINVFENNDRRYNYNSTTKQFEHSSTGKAYTPKPGDYLRRDDIPGDGHSMMIAGWNPDTQIAAVVNGPWPVTIRRVNVDALQGSGHEMQVGRISETLSIVIGDVNGDGVIDIVDALILAMYYVGLVSYVPVGAADVNCDGSVNIVDALCIARYYVGLIANLGC